MDLRVARAPLRKTNIEPGFGRLKALWALSRRVSERQNRAAVRTLLTAERKQRLEQLLSERPDATLAEAHAWTGAFGLPRWIYGSGDWAGGIKKTLAAAEQQRPDVAEKRAHWHEQLASHPVHRLIFVDEGGANTKMTRAGLWEGAGWWAAFPAETTRPAR